MESTSKNRNKTDYFKPIVIIQISFDKIGL